MADDYEHELLPPAERTIVVNALERCIDVSMVLKKDSLTETERPGQRYNEDML